MRSNLPRDKLGTNIEREIYLYRSIYKHVECPPILSMTTVFLEIFPISVGSLDARAL